MPGHQPFQVGVGRAGSRQKGRRLLAVLGFRSATKYSRLPECELPGVEIRRLDAPPKPDPKAADEPMIVHERDAKLADDRLEEAPGGALQASSRSAPPARRSPPNRELAPRST
jgi:hypothetical protein